MKFTVLGSTGFIGNQLANHLKRNGHEVFTPLRDDSSILTKDLGHVFYCIGLTANFRHQPFATINAHVCLLTRLLEHGKFDSLVYLSSTRVYDGSIATNEETSLHISPFNPEHIYNISKIMGESICLTSGRNTKIARLSNVYGVVMPKQVFLACVLKEAIQNKKVNFLTSKNSVKDYVSISDVIDWLINITLYGKHKIYNVASGHNTSNLDISLLLEKKGISTEFSFDALEWSFSIIDTKRIENEFGKPKKNLSDEFDYLFKNFRKS